ncbi:MAG: radical SAM protein, partial [Deltaproteobacteria bacterium]|nr:radical SAM protein [Deltaproteobacteria bacterium]
VLSLVSPHFIRLRTLVPKVNTLLLHQIRKGRFQLLGPHGVLRETRMLVEGLDCTSTLASDHYTNYISLEGRLPRDRGRLLEQVDRALRVDEACYRPQFVGTA